MTTACFPFHASPMTLPPVSPGTPEERGFLIWGMESGTVSLPWFTATVQNGNGRGKHLQIRTDSRMIVFLLASTSRMTERMEERCLSGAASALIPEETAAQIREIFAAGQADPDDAILRSQKG